MLRIVVLLLGLLLASTGRAAPTVAVTDLVNHTGDPQLDGAGPGVAAILVSRLSRVDALQVVERQRLQDVLAELELGASGAVDPATAAEVGRLLGAQYLVVGSITSVKLPTVAIALRVVEAESGRVVLADDVVGAVGERGEEFFVLLDELSFRVIDALEVRQAARDRIALGQVDVRELTTVDLYGDALSALSQGDAGEAEALLARALALEPGFRLAEETLSRLAAEVASRRGAYAHEAITRAHAGWEAVERVVAPRMEGPSSMERYVALAVRSRLHLVRGEIDAHLDLEEARAALFSADPEAVLGEERYPEGRFGGAIWEVLDEAGVARGSTFFVRIPFWPHEVRAAAADLVRRLGRREEAVAALLDVYQHPGPLPAARQWPKHPVEQLERWEVWDVAVVLRQQRLRQLELGGDEEGARKELRELDRALREVEQARKARATVEDFLTRAERGSATPELLRLEEAAARACGDHHDLALRAYRAFHRRGEAGGYDRLRASDPSGFGRVAESWHRVADGLWSDPWLVELRLAHLLAYQEQVPPRDDEVRERNRRKLDEFVQGGFGR